MDKITGYHIKTSLGTGGMASVFLATQTSLDRQVAIKIIDATLIDDTIIQAQFAQESKLIASLNHPNIVQVIDQGISEEGRAYFVMPYIKSITLNAILKRNDINTTRKIDIAIQICKALAYAHRNGVVHRDIKPGNILVDYDGHVRLVDFGIAGYFQNYQKTNISSDDHWVMGTQMYMAPEQHEGNSKTSHLSDIYSLGVVLQQLFFDSTLTSSAKCQKSDETSIPLQILIKYCLEPTPANRPASADIIRQQLLLIAQGKHLKKNNWSDESGRKDIPPQYQLLDILKENPFGATYLAKNPKRDQLLVVKKQRLEHAGNAEKINATLSKLHHPHIARVFGTGKNQRVLITVSEYLSTGSLQERLSQAFSLGQWILMSQQICSALAYAHEQGVVHGNLRPSNILFAEDNFIKITDFGFPSHSYAQHDDWYRLKDESESIGADIYATGVILFQLLSGQHPEASILNWKKFWALRHVPKDLRKIVLRMTHSKEHLRYQTADVVLQALHDFYNQQDTRMARKVFFTRKNKAGDKFES